MGKSRLAREIARHAHAQGAHALFGSCDEESIAPYQPFTEAGRYYLAKCPVPGIDVRRSAGSCRSCASRSTRPELPGAPETERYQLFEAVARLVIKVAEQRPLVLVLDDVHWGDKPTLLMLRPRVRAHGGRAGAARVHRARSGGGAVGAVRGDRRAAAPRAGVRADRAERLRRGRDRFAGRRATAIRRRARPAPARADRRQPVLPRGDAARRRRLALGGGAGPDAGAGGRQGADLAAADRAGRGRDRRARAGARSSAARSR